ncbi:thiol-disulfide oxidoreductase DCC family protein [Serratia marcescens]|uniref:thiol-disulfide oxidoreductase DCC family protein n=1 Tax=Serratia marcescens TaxID=615 RepID=UPI00240514B6|nr:thiol-disulfide oxidoreductase DCC family protein [Serratia marcescens]MDF9720911.1 thiol-disulfide oxidoreductase DCC family protein [Serratia marcescens]
MTPLSQLPYLQPGDRVLLFDGECNLCHGLVRDLIRADRQRRILLATVQSVEGQAILLALGLPTDRFDSVVYVEQGRYWLRSAALFQALRQMTWPYRALALGRCLPPQLADKVYDAVAGNRYRLFGRNDGSGLPGADQPGRYLPRRREPPA